MTDPDHPGSSSQIKLDRFLRKAQREVGPAGEVSVRITSNREMRRLNRDFRGIDQATDVLSFPAAQNGRVAGDIAISSEIAEQNAKVLGHSLETELKVLLLHGLLHLAGHDHESDQGEMAALEQKLRTKFKLPMSLIERNGSAERAQNADATDVVPGIPNGASVAPGRAFRRSRETVSNKKALTFPRAPGRSIILPAEGGRNHVNSGRNHVKSVRKYVSKVASSARSSS